MEHWCIIHYLIFKPFEVNTCMIRREPCCPKQKHVKKQSEMKQGNSLIDDPFVITNWRDRLLCFQSTPIPSWALVRIAGLLPGAVCLVWKARRFAR